MMDFFWPLILDNQELTYTLLREQRKLGKA